MSVSRVVAVVGTGALLLAAAPVAAAQPPDDVGEIDDYPIAQGTFTTPDDFYFVYFKTPDWRSCGIGPDGGPVGCDAVPKDAPEGTNQTVVNPWAPAEYRDSDTASFTRDVDVLPEGYRLENCGVGHQGTVHCKTYNEHGFVLSSVYGVLW
jgi:hypothetical protein